jgi:deoxycytidine triphosphate deaminase
MFSKQAIKAALERELLKISPFHEGQIENAHINLHISGKSDLTISAKEFVLAKTAEKVTFAKSICGFVEGRASLAKLGLSVEQSSTFIEPESNNQITLEIFNASDKEVTIEAGQEIAKMFIMKVIDTF